MPDNDDSLDKSASTDSPTSKPDKPKPGERTAAIVLDAKQRFGINLLKVEPRPDAPKPRRNYREVLYSEDVAKELFARVLSGEPMARICAEDHMPSYVTVWQWQQDKPEFKESLEKAKREGSHYIADDCVRIADDQTIDPMHKRIMVDTRLRLIKSWHRKAYGDNVQLSGDENGSPVRFFIDGLSDRETK